ncbi:MAG: carcinine hydrolase/isopenicillin-N N-acyltransferase family protein, partial [Chloroflexi bacterium]|nr:carcinine hydrolase/isopenicillin-N N-acyltransferase family protein [Chloroflexota bacterium]
DCVALLQENRVCGAANIVLCDGQGDFCSVEVRPDRAVRFDDDHSDRMVHTNHYLNPELVAFQDRDVPPNSYHRLERMRKLIQDHWGQIDANTMKLFLANHEDEPASICRHGGPTPSHSIAGYVAEPAKGLFHVRRGRGCSGSWETYAV